MNKKHLCLVIVFVIIGKISGAQSWKNYEDSARTAAKSKNNKEIIKYYSLARTTYIKDKNKKDSTYIRLSGTLAAYFRNLNQFEEAENIFLELVNNIEKNNGRKSAEFVDNDLNLADVYLTTGQFPKAETVLLEATGIIPLLPGDNQLLLAQSYNTLAIMYRQIALYEKAEKFYLLTIDILEKQKGQEEGYAITINNLGVLYKFIGKFEDSEKYMLRAKDIKAKIVGTSHEEYALSCGTLGSLYKDIGRFDEAELLFKEACQIFLNKFGEINTDYAIFNTSLGDLYYQTGKYDLAEPCLLKAREILQKIFKKANPPVARVYSGLGVLYNSLGQYDKAIEVLIEAKSMMKEMYGETHPEFLIACNNLSGSYYKKDKLIEAEAIAMEAKSAFDKMPDVDPSINIMVNTLILNFKLQKGDYKEAEAIAIKMWSFADSIYGKESERFFLVCSNLGSLYKEINDKEKSIYYYRMALEAGEKSIGKYHPKIAFISSLLGSMYWSNGQLDKADSVFSITRNVIQYQVRQQFSFQSEKEKFQFIKTTEEDSRLLYSFFNDMHVPDSIRNPALLSLSLDNKAMLMESLKKMRAQILSSTDTVVTNIYKNWTKTREQLSYWLSRPLAERNGKDLELEERADKLEKELTKLSTDFSKQQSQKNISWQKIKDKLKPGEAAIEFLDYPFYNGSQFTDSTYYVCLVLRKDKPYPELVKLFEKKQLEKAMWGYKGKYEKKIDSAYSLPDLYKLIWQPVSKKIEGISRVYFSLSGLLNQINITALPSGKNKILNEDYELFQVNSIASIADFTDDLITVSDKLLLYGGIKFEADTTEMKAAALRYNSTIQNSLAFRGITTTADPLPELPFSEEEVEKIKTSAIRTKRAVTVLKGANANEESVKAINENISPEVIHFATHGKFFPDPVKKITDEKQTGIKIFSQSENPLFRSMLMLAGANNLWTGKQVNSTEDGILTAYEISNINLSHTKLAVLSACETGLGDIQGSEGVYGLQRAFKIAGVQNLVMSLWSIADNTTSEFMNIFYDQLFLNKHINEAFRFAQGEMKKKYPAEPNKWAGIILVH